MEAKYVLERTDNKIKGTWIEPWDDTKKFSEQLLKAGQEMSVNIVLEDSLEFTVYMTQYQHDKFKEEIEDKVAYFINPNGSKPVKIENIKSYRTPGITWNIVITDGPGSVMRNMVEAFEKTGRTGYIGKVYEDEN